jgi:hypothetical protein
VSLTVSMVGEMADDHRALRKKTKWIPRCQTSNKFHDMLF